MTLYRLLSTRYLLRRWDRAVLIVASIALGVATLVSARTLNRCIAVAADQSTTPLKAADLFVTNGDAGVPLKFAAELRGAALPGVAAVRPLVIDRVMIDVRSAILVGADFSAADASTATDFGVTVTPVTPPAAALFKPWAVVSRPLYDAGRPLVTLKVGTRSLEFAVVGVLDFSTGSPMAALGQNVVGLDVAAAARFTRPAKPGEERVGRIDITLSPTADRAAARAAVENFVGPRASVTTPQTNGVATEEIVGGMQVGFLLSSAGTMVVGLFLVYNALSVTVAERRPDIGVLRSVGATRWQIVKLFTAAAVVLGLIGSALGIPLGLALARYTLAAFSDELGEVFLATGSDPAGLTWDTALIAAAAGVATAVLASLIPSLQAASADPADAVRRTGNPAGRGWKWLHRLTCFTLVFGGIAAILVRQHLPHRTGAFGGMLAALVGMLLATPLFVTVGVRLLQPLLRRALPIEARLAADNLTRSPGRTGVVIGALAAGVTVMIQTAGVGRSNEDPIVAWLEEVLQADEFVFAGSMVEATSSMTPIDAPTVAGLRAIPGAAVVAQRYSRPEYGGTLVFLVAVDFAAFADNTQPRAPGGAPRLDAFRAAAGTEQFVVSDNFLARHHKKVGDVISLPGPNGPVSLPIAASFVDYSWSRGTVFLDKTVYAKLYRDDDTDICHVFLDPGADRGAVRRFCDDRGLLRQDRVQVRKFFAELIDRVYLFAYLQQIVVGIVAALGVVTALLISVLQRKRELGLLLAVGATPAQVVRSVLAEAAFMGFFGAALGAMVGVPLEWYVVQIILTEETGFAFATVIPWRAGFGIAAGAMVIATLAGLLPALHAVRTRIPDAIQYE